MSLTTNIAGEAAQSAYSYLRYVRKNPHELESVAKNTVKIVEDSFETHGAKVLGSINSSVVEKGFDAMGSLMASIPKRITDLGKLFEKTNLDNSDLGGIQKARTKMKIALSSNPKAQEWLKELSNKMQHPDVKNMVAEIAKFGDVKTALGFSSVDDFIKVVAKDSPKYQEFASAQAAKMEKMLSDPAGTYKQQIDYFIKK